MKWLLLVLASIAAASAAAHDRAIDSPAPIELAILREELARRPEDPSLAAQVALGYLQLDQMEPDPRNFDTANAALAPWRDDPRAPLDVLFVRARIRQHRHEFDSALADLDRLLARQPRNAQAWFTKAIILQARGRPDEALRSCAPLWRLAGQLSAAACTSSAASLAGRADASYRVLAESLARSVAAPDSQRQWALTTLAEIAVRMGRHPDAERHFRASLEITPNHVYTLGAYADFLLDQHRAGEARALLQDRTDPDALLLRFALAEQALGTPQRADRVAELIAELRTRFDAHRARGDHAHLGPEARFELHLLAHPARALDLAQQNWTSQREPRDARILLEASLAAHRPEAAAPLRRWLDETGLEDVRLLELVAQLPPLDRADVPPEPTPFVAVPSSTSGLRRGP